MTSPYLLNFSNVVTNNNKGNADVNLTATLVGEEEKEFLGDYFSSEGSAFPLYLRLWATLLALLIFIVGVGGNALVPILMWQNRQLRHSTNIFLLNLALADSLVLLVCLPTSLVELHTVPNTWVLGEVLCE